MGAIAFSAGPEGSWAVAGWAFRQVLDDVAVQYPEDSEMRREFEKAKALSGLMVYMLPPDLAASDSCYQEHRNWHLVRRHAVRNTR